MAHSAWNLTWYEEDIEFQNIIRLVIARAQKPVGVTAAGFYYISLESYYNVKRVQKSDSIFKNIDFCFVSGIESILFLLCLDEFSCIWLSRHENNDKPLKYSKEASIFFTSRQFTVTTQYTDLIKFRLRTTTGVLILFRWCDFDNLCLQFMSISNLVPLVETPFYSKHPIQSLLCLFIE